MMPLVEIRSCLSAGGERGVFATEDIAPGTLLMHEAPFFVVNDNGPARSQSLHFQMALAILTGALANDADRETFQQLHPRVLDAAMIKRGELQHRKSVDDLCEATKCSRTEGFITVLSYVGLTCPFKLFARFLLVSSMGFTLAW